jgi:UDP-N-acetylmuramoyl-tripeptide--D-alanyl-D-alanine ligase
MKTDQLYSLFKQSTGVTTDSRKVVKGQIFFALWGNNYNGNKFAAEAIDKGALCAVIDDPLLETENTLLVDDCLLELQALAANYRRELNVPVLAITGTNGKTTTKELLAAVLSKKLKVHFTQGNLNNHIGVPLTILSAPADTQLLLIEMGASHVGEIRTLCLIARPDYGIITNIGTAHLEGFGSLEGVAKAKTELYEHLRKINGVAIYNDNDQLLAEKIFKIVNRAVPYSDPTGIELVVEALPSDMNLKISVTYLHHNYVLNTSLFGIYNLENVKAAIATGLFLGIDIEDIVDAVENYHPANNRSQLKDTSKNRLICDSYNANPTSMMVALDSFAELKNGEKIVILGDMLELGDRSEQEHLKILEKLKAEFNCEVFLVGPVFKKVASGSGFSTYENADSLAAHLKANQIRGKSILIKGSRGVRLEKLYEFL